MIQMPSVRPVPWAATSGGVQAVSPVRPTQPVVGAKQDAADPAAREQSNVPAGTASTTGASQADQAATRRVTGGTNAQPMDLARERELQREQVRQAEEKAERDREAIERLREVLTSVWEASAAVVEQALSENAEGGTTSDTSPDLGALAGMQRARRVMVSADKSLGQTPAQGGSAPLPGDLPNLDGANNGAEASGTGAVLAYDERGQGNPDRLGAGRIISQRV